MTGLADGIDVDTLGDFARVGAFAGLDEAGRRELVEAGEIVRVAGGSTLFTAGAPATHLYVVLRGRIAVGEAHADRLETLGATGLLGAGSYEVTARAVRDSVLLAFSEQTLTRVLDAHPAGYRTLVRDVVAPVREARAGTGTFAVVPTSVDVPVRVLAETMISRLGGWPAARLITAEHVDAELGEGTARAALTDGGAGGRIARWLDDLERRHRYLVFAADSGRDPWAARCVRNADRILVLAEALATPTPVPVLPGSGSDELVAPVELVLLRPDGDGSPHTLGWRQVTGARAHYFVHPWDRVELDSLARQVTGRGVAVVLGGGGARGFAHIGLVRAMEELGLTVDLAGGTSMGAFMGALLACGYHSGDLLEISRETFVRANYLNDYTVPRSSLIRGRKFKARLADVFGSRTIEELRRSYFCVATNLTTGEPIIADRGPLATWVGISMAVPGVAPPPVYNGDLLCDGGVVDNLPILPMRRLERGAIVACNVSTDGALRAPGAGTGDPDFDALLDWKGAGAAPRLAEILVRTAMLSSQLAADSAAEAADVYVRMPVQDFGMFDWKSIDELADLGYEFAREQLLPALDRLR